MEMEQKLTKLEQKRIEEKTEVMNIIINLKDNQHKITKKLNGKIKSNLNLFYYIK
jgi:hypothetical protein